MSFFSNTPQSINAKICKVEILPMSDLANFEYTPDFEASDILPLPGKEFQEVVFSERSISFSDNSDETGNGIIYKYKISFRIAKILPLVYSNIYANQLNRFMVRIHLLYGEVLVVPNMKLLSKLIHPGRLTQYSGFDLSFDYSGLLPLLQLSDKYSLQLIPSIANASTLTGEGNYSATEQVNINAVPLARYNFLHWRKDAQIISSDADYSFEMPAEDLIYIAQLEEKDGILVSIEATNGSATGAGVYTVGQEIVLSATPSENYTFTRWEIKISGIFSQIANTPTYSHGVVGPNWSESIIEFRAVFSEIIPPKRTYNSAGDIRKASSVIERFYEVFNP